MEETVKNELARKAKQGRQAKSGEGLRKSMGIEDLILALEAEIRKALPSVITPERFTRMALSALNTTPALRECTQMSFLAALMNAAQLGLEPNTPLGQAYLIPYKNKGVMECQFQIGYRGMIDLAYRNDHMQSIEAHTVHENDIFQYELGLSPQLVHRPAMDERGEVKAFYAVFRLDNGGFRFEVMGKGYIDWYAERYSRAYASGCSPWKSNYEGMAKKTVIKQLLKYAPLKAEFQRALSTDGTVKTRLEADMGELPDETVYELPEQ